MSAYHLRDVGVAFFKKIFRNRKCVGRVCHHQAGGYLGVIGKTTARGATEREAFDEVCARDMGYSSAAALRVRNKEVRATNRVVSRAARLRAVDLLQAIRRVQ